MPIYPIAVACTIVVSAAVLLLVFSRLKLLNRRILLSVTLSSMICAMALPGIFYAVSGSRNGTDELSAMLFVAAIAVALYVTLAFILSVVVSYVIPAAGSQTAAAVESSTAEAALTDTSMSGDNLLEQIYDNMVNEKGKETANNDEIRPMDENYLEISVDSSENIDKMGIENIVPDSDILTIEECIEEAFRYKMQGDAEEAILYYMYALDKEPCKELTFWIVLDICVMYKTLGQYELAFDILNTYYDTFGDIMEASVKEEIESNLFNIKA